MSELTIVRVTLHGHLTKEQLERELGVPALQSVKGKIGLFVDCLQMKSYDTEARSYFVEWHKKMQPHIEKTAVVLNQPVWRIVVSAMGLAASMPMTAFDTSVEAERWLRTR